MYYVLMARQSWEQGGEDIDRPLYIATNELQRDDAHERITMILKDGIAATKTGKDANIAGRLKDKLGIPDTPAHYIEEMATGDNSAVKLAPVKYDPSRMVGTGPNSKVFGIDSEYSYDLVWFRVPMI
jgi:hypothetical protein